MGWIYLAESVESQKPWRPGCGQQPIVKQINSVSESFFPQWQEDKLKPLQSAQMLEMSGGGVRTDFVSAGFPCQDISSVGLGKGLDGERSGLFFEVIRIVGESRPQFVFLENVAAITFRGGWRVTAEFAKLGYDIRWAVISAYSIGASHLRERWFALAHSNKDGFKRTTQRTTTGFAGEVGGLRSQFPPKPFQEAAWDEYILENPSLEPIVCRGPHGLPNGTNRIGILGNSVVPQQVRKAFQVLMGIK